MSRRSSIGGNTQDRRPRLKALAAASAQERRRQDFISHQRKARRNLADHARLLATVPAEEEQTTEGGSARCHSSETGLVQWDSSGGSVDDMAIDSQRRHSPEEVDQPTVTQKVHESGDVGQEDAYGPGRGRSRRRGVADNEAIKRRDHWAHQLCVPEWMLTVPSDLNGAGSSLGAGWYVMARPEGKRVLVISSKGETIARQMSGAVTHRFSSNLPGGSVAGRRGRTKGGGYCILDCVFHELDQTFFVLDMMAWKGYPLYDCTTDFRFYWVRTKLLEADGPLDVTSSRNMFRIKPTPYHECDRQGLAHAYASPMPFIKDGLVFYLKAAHYQLGPTPLVLLWKDKTVARYLGVEGQQAMVLRVEDGKSRDEHDVEGVTSSSLLTVGDAALAARGTAHPSKEACHEAAGHPLLTCDSVWLGDFGANGDAFDLPQVKQGELLRFTLTGAEEEFVPRAERYVGGKHCPRGMVHGLRFEKRCSVLRPMADSWSKVLFQARLRHGRGVSINDIDASCAASCYSHVPKAASTLEANPEEADGFRSSDEDDML